MAAFPSFELLPVELQQAVWEAAVPAPRATAYATTVTVQRRHCNEDGSRGPNARWQAHLHHSPSQRGSNSSSDEPIRTLSSLLVCCRRASSVAVAAHRQLLSQPPPQSPLSLRGLAHDIDADRDLLMFRPGWQAECEHGERLAAHYAPPRILHNLGFLWPSSPEGSSFFDSCSTYAIHQALLLWHDLEAVYVVVDPELLAPRPWIPRDDREWEESLQLPPDADCLAHFLANYRLDQEQHQREPKSFYGPCREYYEASADVVAAAGGLEHVAEFLFAARYQINWPGAGPDSDRDPQRYLILSWRDA